MKNQENRSKLISNFPKKIISIMVIYLLYTELAILSIIPNQREISMKSRQSCLDL